MSTKVKKDRKKAQKAAHNKANDHKRSRPVEESPLKYQASNYHILENINQELGGGLKVRHGIYEAFVPTETALGQKYFSAALAALGGTSFRSALVALEGVEFQDAGGKRVGHASAAGFSYDDCIVKIQRKCEVCLNQGGQIAMSFPNKKRVVYLAKKEDPDTGMNQVLLAGEERMLPPLKGETVSLTFLPDCPQTTIDRQALGNRFPQPKP